MSFCSLRLPRDGGSKQNLTGRTGLCAPSCGLALPALLVPLCCTSALQAPRSSPTGKACEAMPETLRRGVKHQKAL